MKKTLPLFIGLSLILSSTSHAYFRFGVGIVPVQTIVVPVHKEIVYTQTHRTPDPELTQDITDTMIELKAMKAKRAEIENKIDAFYDKSNQSDPHFIAELRRIKYYEGKLQDLDKKIEQAQEALNKLNHEAQVKEATTTQTQVYTTTETLVTPAPYYDCDSLYYPYRHRSYPHRVGIQYTPPVSTQYYENKKTYMQGLKNR